ncbi:MAG: hypothetical protein EHM61_09530 [Acidobacteria bacterium]|nr:MAG: hypothetical protein EHM61_09530 [Acidobacteriota bacterium]
MLKTALIASLLLQPLLAADPLYDAFRNPPATARPFVRWWWNGSRVNEKEILRELDVMKAAGIGGVEINTIAMLEAVPPKTLQGFPPVPWLSPEWNRMVKTATDGTRARGMVADLIVGSGWPFGGRFLEPSEQTQRITVVRKTVSGPTFFESTVQALAAGRERRRRSPEEVAAQPKLAFLRLVPREGERFDPGTDFMSSASASGVISFEVPKGDFILYAGLREEGFTYVKLGAPGADGPVVNHFDARAVRKYLDNMSKRLGPDLGGRLGTAIRAAFVDSLELDHANWTSDFPEQFERRRGYSVWPCLPFILDSEAGRDENNGGDTIRRARYDFCKTLVELFHERFVRTYVAWCRENGIKARIQAYGRETHPLGGSMLVDLPEGESWLWGEEDRVVPSPTVVNKYVSSAAHLSGKHQISFEAMTNAVPVFRETLQDFKLCFDMSLMSGVLHPVVHGFNYTPPEAGFPGWVRFGCYLNDRNPWWPYFRLWTDYASRLSSVLIDSEAQASVAILGPRADEWSRDFLLYQPFPEVARPWYHYHLWQALNQLGLSSDFVSEEILQQARFERGRLKFGTREYDVLILQDVESLEPETAEAVTALARSGGKIVFVGQAPSRSPGLRDAAARDLRVKKAIEDILAKRSGRVWILPAPRPSASLHKDFVRMGLGDEDRQGLLKWAGDLAQTIKVKPPFLSFEHPSPDVLHVHHRHRNRDILLFSNISRTRATDLFATVASTGKTAWKWDPETGLRNRFDGMKSGGRLNIHLEPAESLLLVLEPGTQKRTGPTKAGCPCGKDERALPLNPVSGWQVAFQHVIPEKSFSRNLTELRDISKAAEDPALATFAGRIVYKTRFENQSGEELFLDLGQVSDVSEVRLNGKPLGVRWWGRHVYETKGALRKGQNELEVQVTTMLGNYLKSLQNENPVAKRWAFWFPPISAGLVGPVRLLSD